MTGQLCQTETNYAREEDGKFQEKQGVSKIPPFGMNPAIATDDEKATHRPTARRWIVKIPQDRAWRFVSVTKCLIALFLFNAILSCSNNVGRVSDAELEQLRLETTISTTSAVNGLN